MRFHLPGLAHTETSKKDIMCAFTQKVFKASPILIGGENEVIHYGHEKSTIVCDEHVSITNDADLRESLEWQIQHQDLPENYNPRRDGYVHSADDPVTIRFNNKVADAIRERYQPDDFLLIYWNGHEAIADLLKDLPDLHVVEAGIGYPTTFSEYRVFESYAKMHLVRGEQTQIWDSFDGVMGGHPKHVPLWFDTVIPNYWDVSTFPKEPAKKKDYIFFIGRLDKVKGLDIAVQTARVTGRKLVIAGQGDLQHALGGKLPNCDYEYIGIVNEKKRNKWMSEAHIGLTPSLYIEPFCGTHVEFWLNWNRIAATPWGVFSETVKDGYNGYKCVQFSGGDADNPSFVWAVENADTIDVQDCRDYAVKNFSTEAVKAKYFAFFQRILERSHAIKAGQDPFFYSC